MTPTRPTPINHPSPYVTAAIAGELDTLGNLPQENINKPHSAFFACLIRLASVGKAAAIPPGQFVPHIWHAAQASAGESRRPFRDVERQWRNAWHMAVPRQLPTAVGNAGLLPPTATGAYSLG